MPAQHPLSIELASLKSSLEKYQHVAYTSTLQLQRAQFEATEAAAHSRMLETHNARLQQEIDASLKSNHDTIPNYSQVSELTLELKRMADKLSITEDTLLQKTADLTHSLSEASRLRLELTEVHAELDNARQREEAALVRGRELEESYKVTKEEVRMADAVVVEYAALVRSLESRRSNTSKSETVASESRRMSSSAGFTDDDTRPRDHGNGETFVQSLQENRASLRRLLQEFNKETSYLQAEIVRLHAELSSMRIELDSERENSKEDRAKLAEALLELDRRNIDDKAAARVVSGYMQFSQSCINTLQTALSDAKSRHATALATLSSSSRELSQALAAERKRTFQLHDVLDGLVEDISRETFGRRREVSLRLQSVVREERTTEALRSWLRRAEESRARLHSPTADIDESSYAEPVSVIDGLEETLDGMIRDAAAMLASLSYEDHLEDAHENSLLGRVILAEDMVRSLNMGLEKEVEKRTVLIKEMARDLVVLPSETAEVQVTNAGAHSPPSNTKGSPILSVHDSVPFPSLDETPSSAKVDPSTEATFPLGTQMAPQEENSGLAAERRANPSSQTELEDNVTAIGGSSSDSTSAPEALHGKLANMSRRYDMLQRGFHDCHLTLDKMKADVVAVRLLSQSDIQDVIHRLDDFCEDARVELEIRIADEERIAKGFETLLDVPGALTDDSERDRIEKELEAFLDDTAPFVVKTIESCKSKLQDLQHDIAQVKKFLHESVEMVSAEDESKAPTQSPAGWHSWTPSFLSGSSTRLGTVFAESQDVDLSSHLGLRITMPSRTHTESLSIPITTRLRKSTLSSAHFLGLGYHSKLFLDHEPTGDDSLLSNGPGLDKSNNDIE